MKNENTNHLQTEILHDEITKKICQTFTIDEDEQIIFQPHVLPDGLIPDDFSIGLIVGSSGSGKTLLLKTFGNPEVFPEWSNLPIASHFESYEDCESRLLGAGLNSIPMWLSPYHILSNGQKYRANMARLLNSGAVFDEFTSVIDRDTAKSLSNSIKGYIRRNNLKNIVFAAPHHDIAEYLEPDWMYDTDTKKLIINNDTHEQQVHYLDKKYLKVDNKKKVHFMEFEC